MARARSALCAQCACARRVAAPRSCRSSLPLLLPPILIGGGGRLRRQRRAVPADTVRRRRADRHADDGRGHAGVGRLTAASLAFMRRCRRRCRCWLTCWPSACRRRRHAAARLPARYGEARSVSGALCLTGVRIDLALAPVDRAARPDGQSRRMRHRDGTERFGQIDAPRAHRRHARPRVSGSRTILHRRRRDHASRARTAAHRHSVSGRSAVSASFGRRQSGVRAARAHSSGATRAVRRSSRRCARPASTDLPIAIRQRFPVDSARASR